MTDKSRLHCCIVLFLPYTALISRRKNEVRYKPTPSKNAPQTTPCSGGFSPKTADKRHRQATTPQLKKPPPCGEICPRFRQGNTKPNIEGSYRLCTLLWGECEHRIRLVTAKPLPAFCCSAGRSPAPTFIKPTSIRRTIIEG